MLNLEALLSHGGNIHRTGPPPEDTAQYQAAPALAPLPSHLFGHALPQQAPSFHRSLVGCAVRTSHDIAALLLGVLCALLHLSQVVWARERKRQCLCAGATTLPPGKKEKGPVRNHNRALHACCVPYKSVLVMPKASVIQAACSPTSAPHACQTRWPGCMQLGGPFLLESAQKHG